MSTIQSTRTIDAVLFDLDGTIADTLPTVLRIFNRLMLERTGRVWRIEELIPYFGPPETVMFRNMFPDHGEHEEITEAFFALSREDGAEIRPFTGIRELLLELRELGIRLGVYSGASTEAARIRVGHAGLIEFFEEVVGGDMVSNYKPHPEGVNLLIERFEVDPQRTVYVGDMVSDIEAGRGAGARTVAVTWGAGKASDLAAARPHHLAEDPESLVNIIKSNI
ncbi:MAG: HAD-IA family hydrolase [Acidobacteriota bacterium]|nr:MAG: HAD-IA family hydrolase [Acidobacteriota bacterium]